MAMFLAALDTTIITTAVPTISEHFQLPTADYTWIGTSYVLAQAATSVLWGKFSDIWGRKPCMILANCIFMAGSLLSATSITAGMLICGRAVQGIGGGGLISLVNICISDMFSLKDRTKYFGLLGFLWAFAHGIGPVLGGVFSVRVSWRWCFYINLPLDGATLILLWIFLPSNTTKTPVLAGLYAIDWFGMLTLMVGVVMILYSLVTAGVLHPWLSATTIGLLLGGVFILAIFVYVEWRIARYPIVPVRLFSKMSNAAAMGVGFVHGFVFIAATYYLPLDFQLVLDKSPLQSGIYILPLTVSLSLAAAAGSTFINKSGLYRPAIWFATTSTTVGMALFTTFGTSVSWPRLIIFQLILGIGVGPNFQSPMIALQAGVDPHDTGVATAFMAFITDFSTSVSIVLGGVILQNDFARNAKHISPGIDEKAFSSSLGDIKQLIRQLPPEQGVQVRRALSSALRTMWVFYAAFAAFGIILSLFIKKQVLSSEHEAPVCGLQEQERIRVELVKRTKIGVQK